MRVLVPTAVATALLVAGWFATGIVTARSIETPDRIGLIGLPAAFLAVLACLFVVSAFALRERRWSSVAHVAIVLVPVVMPWLPVDVPVASLVWTGPLAVFWWVTCVAYVSADACRRLWGAIVPPVLSRAFACRARAPFIAALATGVALTITAWHTAPQHPKGDEPDYLVITQSLLLDRDIRIENNHARADYAVYHPGVLPPSYLQRGTDGAIYSVHAPGLPAALVPAFAVGGYRGAIATLILMAMAGAWLAWRAGWDVTHDARASWIGTAATVGAAPFFLHGAAVFPDAPASVLALLVVWMLVRDAPIRPAVAALALGVLPWLHTRYAILSVGLGVFVLARLFVERPAPDPARTQRAGRRVLAFGSIGLLSALAWFGFFLVIYGTPSPSAPYGAYTQMAFAHLKPGLPGLLFDQQFGLLAAAPILGLAAVAIRPRVRHASTANWNRALAVLLLAGLYTAVVGAYRMWWGGLSAPARFLVPIVLPLAPLVALGWHSLSTRASRHLALTLLVVSLAMTVMLVAVDRGALAYNVRDGQAEWAEWVSPLVDLVSALPAAHRDPPAIVLRDAVVWLATVAAAWGVWRWLEAYARCTPLVAMLTVAVLVPSAMATVWWAHGVSGLAPAASQVRFVEQRARPSRTLVAIAPPDVGNTRNWFDVEIASPPARTKGAYVALRLDGLPAGRYRLFSSSRVPQARLGLTLGEERVSRFVAELAQSDATPSVSFVLPLPANDVVVKGNADALAADSRTWITVDDVRETPGVPAVTRVHEMGPDVWLLPDEGVHPEPGGVWLGGDGAVTVGTSAPGPRELTVRAGDADVVVSWVGSRRGEVRLKAGETRVVTVEADRGRLTWRTRGGFRPSLSTPGSSDARYLAAWISESRLP
ncbi:MAG: hypothetical protein IT182_07540 [Acidobacteria bacterium]|nr:hypothetical protein [Acidobacteriota bacterium]